MQFTRDGENTGITEAVQTPILAPFPEMIVRHLRGHPRVVMCLSLKREFGPWTARRELIQNEIKSLIERLVPLVATVSSRKMRTKILIEWWCGHVGWKWCHVQCPFFWACSQALPATPRAAARKFKLVLVCGAKYPETSVVAYI